MSVWDSDGRIEVRGVIAANGRGELCFFPDSRAEGIPILTTRFGLVVEGFSPVALAHAIDESPARRVERAALEALDPPAHGDGPPTDGRLPGDSEAVVVTNADLYDEDAERDDAQTRALDLDEEEGDWLLEDERQDGRR